MYASPWANRVLTFYPSYFNLSGLPTIEGTEVILTTNQHLPVDDNQIPVGKMEPYPGITAKSKFTLGPDEPDIDSSFIVDSSPSGVPTDTRSRPLQRLAAFHHPGSKIHLEVYSTEPSFQFYTGKYIDVPAVPGQPARGARSGFALEPTRYVNAINNDDWRGMVVLRKGAKYGSRIVYQAWRDRKG